MERLTIRTVKGAALKMADIYPDKAAAVSDLMQKYRLAVDRLAAYEDTGLWPENITKPAVGCVFYCNRQCNLDGDWCAEGPGCPYEMDAESARQILVRPDNVPLTIEELREMDGEPVWRVRTDGTRAEWAIICASDDMCKNSIGETAMFSSYGERWLAYRRKSEGTR